MLLTSWSVENLKQQIVKRYNPVDIILFGSYAKGVIRKASDVDLCIIIDTDDKRKLLQDIYMTIESELDFDVIIYTQDEWARYKTDSSTFGYIVFRTGVSIVDRH